MAIKNPRTLVIDASIAQSSGENILKEKAIACSEFLNEILNLGHFVIFTRDIKTEWTKHQSTFAISWYQKMLAKGRVKIIKDDIRNTDLRNAVLEIVQENARAAVLKDLHLIEAARSADEIVASLDDKMRNHLKLAALKVEILQTIVWVNPWSNDKEKDEKCILWLREGAPADKERCLGYRSEGN